MALMSIVSCSTSDQAKAEILSVITTRSTALNTRDLTRYVSVISRQYNDKGKGFIQLNESLEHNFRDFENISYEADPPAITINGNQAEATGSYRMKVRVRGKDLALSGREHLRLAKEPGGWKIIAGI